MGRPKKTETSKSEEIANAEVTTIEESNITDEIVETIDKKEDDSNLDVPSEVEAIMRLYPQYKSLWITSQGFVHPEGAPAYLTKGAKLYQNKFFKNK